MNRPIRIESFAFTRRYRYG